MTRFTRALHVVGLTHLVAILTGAALKGVDKVVKDSVQRVEAPTGDESFGADLDALVRQWRRRGVPDSDLRLELHRKMDTLR